MSSQAKLDDSSSILEGDTPTLIGDEDASVSSHAYRPAQTLIKGEELGRYVVLRELGAGAMGTIYLAYDPELDRKVALKMLREARGEASRRALIGEAQAMAKLRHPNVVAVHDVGEHEGRIYVAMEFIEGRTLAQWLAGRRRGWREVLEVFLRAGKGLEAAHAHELIHRDFKPANVMISDHREVLVMDFGLARPSSSADHDDDALSDEELRTISSSVLTEATVGRIAGTPAYMPPEQIGAEALTPAADQFAYCVSIWEGVCGQRPFPGKTIAELYTSVSEGQLRPLPPGVRMPRWLERALRRGLAADPTARWASIGALMATLERGRNRWRWQAGLTAGAVIAALVGALIGQLRHDERLRLRQLDACAATGASIDEVWNDAARERLRAGMLASGFRLAPQSIETIIPWLDDYRAAWSEGRTQVCLRGSVRGDWDSSMVERARWCFEDRRLQLDATIDQISALEKATARRAVRLASYLEPVDACLDPNLVHRLPLPPHEIRAEIRELRAQFAEIDRLRHTGHYAESLARAQQVHARAQTLGWPPLSAQARFLEGRASLLSGRFEQAAELLTQAYFDALEAGSTEVAFRSARSLMHTLANLDRHAEVVLWSRHAEVLSAELDDPLELDAAEGHYLLIRPYIGLGDYEAAIAAGEAAVEIRTKGLGAEHPITAAAVRVLCSAYIAAGRSAEALPLLEQAERTWAESVGYRHPSTGTIALQQAHALLELGRPEEALTQAERGLELLEQTVRADHPYILRGLERLALIHDALGREAEASEARARAEALAGPARTP